MCAASKIVPGSWVSVLSIVAWSASDVMLIGCALI